MLFIVILLILMATLSFVVIFGKSSSKSKSFVSTVLAPVKSSSSVEFFGQIADIYSNPDKLLIAANDGTSYVVLINSSTEVIRDVGGTVGGTFTFNSLRVGDLVVARGNETSDGIITPRLVEQINSRGID